MVQRSLLAGALLLSLCGCRTTPPHIVYHMQDLGVVQDVLPLAVQPDLVKWRALKVGMTEAEVTALLGKPYRKNPRPPDNPDLMRIDLYGWTYGEITFASFTTQGSFSFVVQFYQGKVYETYDPWSGRFSPDGRPTVPELVLPEAGKTFDHFPRFMDFRWHPSSGVYPIEYEVAIQMLQIDQEDAEHFEDYIRKTIDEDRGTWQAEGMAKKEIDKFAAAVARSMRQGQEVIETSLFRTHDIYLPFTWDGANTGRWRVQATNEKGTSEWSAWRYFNFSN